MLGPAPEFLIQQVWNLHLGQVHSHAAATTLGPPFENHYVRGGAGGKMASGKEMVIK